MASSLPDEDDELHAFIVRKGWRCTESGDWSIRLESWDDRDVADEEFESDFDDDEVIESDDDAL